jgi:anti-sigma B factor antagonist
MEMTIETIDNGIARILLVGRLDIAGAQKVDLQFTLATATHRKVIVDLEHVAFLASMGLRTLIMGAKSMKSKQGRMVLLKPSPDVEKVLVDSGTATIIPIAHDLDAAIASVTA